MLRRGKNLSCTAPSGTVVLGLLAVVMLLVIPLAGPERYLLKVLDFVGIAVIVTAGLALLFGYAGQVSLGHAGFVGIGAYTSAHLVSTVGVPWLVGVAAAVAVSTLGGLILALPSLRLRGHYLAMATLGFNEIMYVVFREARMITGGHDGFGGIPYPSIGGFTIDTPLGIYLLVWVVAAVVVFFVWSLVQGRPGRAMRALQGSEIGAEASGIDTVRLKVRVFALSAGLAGLAGALYAHAIGFISPSTFGLDQSIIYLAIVVVGGGGSIVGPVVAAVLLSLLPYADALLPNLSKDTVTLLQAWETDIYGLTMILVAILVPGGLASLVKRRKGRDQAVKV
jgi:branched-chain amino acid transport system permease protein